MVSDHFVPSTRMAAGATAGALVELHAGDPTLFTGATVEFELRRSGADAVLSRSPARVNATELPGRRVAEGSIATANLPEGSTRCRQSFSRAAAPSAGSIESFTSPRDPAPDRDSGLGITRDWGSGRSEFGELAGRGGARTQL
jgi:hypothetical protein